MRAAALQSHGVASWVEPCPICRAYFNRNGRRVYCSDQCKDVADLWEQALHWERKRRQRSVRTCVQCDVEFMPARDASYFCSATCGSRYWGAYGVTRRRFAKAEGAGITPAQWAEVLAAFANRCAYCAADGPLTQDHVHPLVRGGRHEPANIVPACRSCNSRKRALPLAVWLGFAEPGRIA